MKDFGSTSIKEKILIACQVIAGEKIQTIARKHKVSRPSVYTWTQKALDTLEQALKPGERDLSAKKVKWRQKIRSLKNKR